MSTGAVSGVVTGAIFACSQIGRAYRNWEHLRVHGACFGWQAQHIEFLVAGVRIAPRKRHLASLRAQARCH